MFQTIRCCIHHANKDKETHIQADIHLHLIATRPRGEKETHIQADIHLHLIATRPRGETRIQIKKRTYKQIYIYI